MAFYTIWYRFSCNKIYVTRDIIIIMKLLLMSPGILVMRWKTTWCGHARVVLPNTLYKGLQAWTLNFRNVNLKMDAWTIIYTFVACVVVAYLYFLKPSFQRPQTQQRDHQPRDEILDGDREPEPNVHTPQPEPLNPQNAQPINRTLHV